MSDDQTTSDPWPKVPDDAMDVIREARRIFAELPPDPMAVRHRVALAGAA